MDLSLPPGIERFPRHLARLEGACAFAKEDPDVVGMAIAGSFATGETDEYSDVDLRVVVEDEALDAVLARSDRFAAAAGPVVASFTGEHVGEPNILIVLYEDLVHVDFLFIEVSRVAEHNKGLPCRVLWERDGRVDALLPGTFTPDAHADLAWMEARMWTWSWYIQSKILRGELYETLDGLQFIRDQVLFKLLAMARGVRPRAARRMEELVGHRADAFAATVPALDRGDMMGALRATMNLYVILADPLMAQHGVVPNDAARKVARQALDAGLDWVPPVS